MKLERVAAAQLSARFLALPAERRREFVARLQGRGLELGLLPIPPGVGRDTGALSFAQERLWFLAQLEPESSAYNMSAVARLSGVLDANVLERCLCELVLRHDALRTKFVTVDGLARAEISDVSRLKLRRVELPCGDGVVRRRVEEEAAQPFALERDALLRATLFRIDPEQHVLLLVVHHIVSDGWSMNVLMQDFVQLYSSLRGARPAALPELEVRYQDYAHFQRALLEAGELERQLSYWKARLGSDHSPLELPADRARPAVQSYRGAKLDFAVPNELALRVRELAREQGATPFMVLLTSFVALLTRLTSRNAIRVGVPVANRDRLELEGLVGLFLNTLVLPFEVDFEQSFAALLTSVRESTIEAQAHADVPFEKLVEALQPERSLSHSPLFQVMYNHQQRRTAVLGRIETLRIEALRWDAETTQFDLSLDTEEDEEGRIHATFSFASDLFEPARIARLGQQWLELLADGCSEPRRAIRELRVLSSDQRQRLLDWSRGPGLAVADRGESVLGPVLSAIEAQVERHPGAEAVVSADERLTYAELWARSGVVAATLKGYGIGREARVGLSVERSLGMVVGLLGILRAGGAFVPLDPGYPQERVRFLARDAGLAAVVTQLSVLERLAGAFEGLPQVELDRAGDSTALGVERGAAPILPEQLAYVIYTSGSTGQPKGVAVSHGAITRHCRAIGAAYGMAHGETMLQFASLSFDGALDQWLAPLMHGARVVVRGRDLWSAEHTFAVLCAERVSIADFLPAYLLELARWLSESGRQLPLRVCAVGGEALSRDGLELVRSVVGQAAIINGYGPTEAVVTPMIWVAPTDSANDTVYAPIGRPIGDRSAYVLDSALELQPVGVSGELYLGGPTLARGYAGRAGLTAERFIPDPWGADGARLYRTGDLARWRDDGTVEYLGRRDRQIKLRGYRIEQGEVEAVLLGLPGVREAAVVLHERGPVKQLVAYLAVELGALDERALKRALSERLPEFMVPAEFVVLAELPRTPNGKLDERALPEPERRLVQRRAPHSEVEQILAGVWQATLGVEEIGLDDNFFELGGDSIVSIQVVSRARAAGLDISPRDVFLHQTLARLAGAASVRGQASQAEQGPVTGVVPLTPIQRQFFAQDIATREHFNQAVLLSVRGELDLAALKLALESLLVHHDALRLRFRGSNAGVEQRYVSEKEATSSLSLWAEQARDTAEVTQICQRAQRSLSIDAGPLLRAVHIALNDGSQRLLLVVHHLVVDGVSWRVLLEDLEAAYGSAVRGQAARLPAKTSSFLAWSERLTRWAASAELASQVEYWETALAGMSVELPRDSHVERACNAEAHTVVVRLSSERTEQLLRSAPRAYRSRVDELLLAALARALGAWSGADHALIEVEGHGREDLFGVDLSRTVGWFSSLYPVRFAAQSGLADSIRAAKERLRGVPERGLGFLVLEQLAKAELAARIQALPKPRITFNYLGQFDQTLGVEQQRFELAKESAGDRVDPLAALDNWLVVNGQVYGSVLGLGFTFGETMYRRETIERLAEGFIAELEVVIEHCLTAEGLTPSDFPLARLSQPELDALELVPSEVEDVYPLTPMQQGMLFHSKLSPELGTYVNQLQVELGSLDVTRFEAAWNRAVSRHPALRTSFSWRDGSARPLQIVHRKVVARVEQHDFRALAAPEDRIHELMQREHAVGFDLARPLLSKLVLVRTAEQIYRLIWTLHHLVLDGWSSARLLTEVLEDYAGRAQSTSVPGSYRDYLAWLEKQELSDAESFWRERISQLDGPTLLGDAVPALDRAKGYGEILCSLEGERFRAARRFVDEQRVTLSTLVQSALGLLLARYSGKDAVALGLTVAGRPVELLHVESTLGLFINTLPAVCVPEPSATVADYVRRTQEDTLALRDYEWTPLYEIQAWAGQAGRSLFDTLLVFENYPIDRALREADFGVSVSNPKVVENTNYPLTVSVHGGDSALRISVRHDRSIFSDRVARRVSSQLQELLQAMVADGGRRLGTLGLAGVPIRKPLPALVEPRLVLDSIASITPQVEAVVCGGDRLSYGELWSRVNGVARALLASGIQAESRVGVLLERSVGLVVGLLGAMRAGGAFVPLDVSYPAERLSLMLEDAAVSVVVTSRSVRARLEAALPKVTWVELEQAESGPAVEVAISAEQLAYVIYTSGSTGRPKGVGVTHGAIARHCAAIGAAYGLGPGETMLQFASMSFDGSLDQWLAPLVHGGRVLLRGPELWEPERTLSELERERVTVADFLPSYLLELARFASERGRQLALRVCAVGGEALSREGLELVQSVSGGASVINGYGPTEAVVTPLTWTATSQQTPTSAYAPIGSPIGDRTVYVLDRNLNALPEGVVGELYLGGPTLARGYQGRSGLTAERFVPDPFCVKGGGRLYRTGDLGRWQSDGALEYVGRADEQVKLRGYRVELGEVEAELLREAEVREAVVVLKESPKRLVGYVVANRDAEVSGAELRARLSKRMPEYMVPSAVVVVAELPRTPVGKVDKRRLPDAERVTDGYAPAETELERQLVGIWQEVLQLERVGVNDNFFDLGGHSILAMRVAGRIRSVLDVALPLSTLFASPTVRELGRKLEESSVSETINTEIINTLRELHGLDEDEIQRLLSGSVGDE